MVMKRHCVAAIFPVAVIALILTASQAQAQMRSDANDTSIWNGEGNRGGGSRQFGLTEEDITRLMEQIKKSDPKKAAEIEKLRKSDPSKFQEELRTQAREEFGKIMRERMDSWRARRREEFVEWLKKEYPKDNEELAALNANEEAYRTKYDLLRNKYGRIFEEERRNPELAQVLKEDLELQKRRDHILARLRQAKKDQDRKRLQGELEEVVGQRFDLIVRRKQIAYEQLLKRIEDLKKQLGESRGDIARWRDKKFKEENVKERLKELTGNGKFKWD